MVPFFENQVKLIKVSSDVKVHQICHIALKRDHKYINTVEQGSEEAHTQVRFFDIPLRLHSFV